MRFNTQPPEGGCGQGRRPRPDSGKSFNTQPPEGGCGAVAGGLAGWCVSTHSRPKAAARAVQEWTAVFRGFNTQPPEGGCNTPGQVSGGDTGFQHTAARRRLRYFIIHDHAKDYVSTHSRPKAAAYEKVVLALLTVVSTHSRPKAAAKEYP